MTLKLYGSTREELQEQYENGDWSPPTDIVDVLFDMLEELIALRPKDYV